MKKSIFVVLLIMMFVSLGLQAFEGESQKTHVSDTRGMSQDGRMVTGLVKDIDNSPLPGATVTVEGTSKGVVTDLDGKFTIKLEGGKVECFLYWL